MSLIGIVDPGPPRQRLRAIVLTDFLAPLSTSRPSQSTWFPVLIFPLVAFEFTNKFFAQ
jgi:hypothetical protein